VLALLVQVFRFDEDGPRPGGQVIAQVAVWNRLLSDAERAWIVNNGAGRPALVAS